MTLNMFFLTDRASPSGFPSTSVPNIVVSLPPNLDSNASSAWASRSAKVILGVIVSTSVPQAKDCANVSGVGCDGKEGEGEEVERAASSSLGRSGRNSVSGMFYRVQGLAEARNKQMGAVI